MSACSKSRRRGFALVAVLWMIALLSALAMAAAASIRGFGGVLAVDRDRVQGEALLTAGLEAGAAMALKFGGRPLTTTDASFALSTGAISVRLSDELGRIDINKAPVEVFASLFAAVGMEGGATLARDIVLWRDRANSSGGERAANGSQQAGPPKAEAAPGKAIGEVVGEAVGKTAPREQAQDAEPIFTDIGQLAQIASVRADHIRAIARYTTVFGDAAVNAATAAPEILLAMPDMNETRVRRLLEARTAFPLDAARIEQILGPAARFLKPRTEGVARLELTATLADGYMASAVAVIVTVPKDDRPYRILRYERSSAPLRGNDESL